MTHLFQHTPHPCRPLVRRKPRQRRWLLLLLVPLTSVVLALASCAGGPAPEPPPVPVTDTAPVGEGLKLIGWALLGAAVVGVIGRLLRS